MPTKPDLSHSIASELLIVSEEESGTRLDKLLSSRFPSYSRSYFQYLIEHQAVLLNGDRVKKREIPKIGDEVEICFLLTEQLSAKPEDIPLDILHEDESLIAVNKPAGLVVHPAPGSPSQTFVNALLYHCQSIHQEPFDTLRPGIVHRLDKDTTGVLIAAKTYQAHQHLVTQFSSRSLDKCYLAICAGKPKEGLLSAPIKRHPIRRQEMAVAEGGKEALSHIKILSHHEGLSLVKVQLLTGRTHQIRVHLKYLGSPILGDPLYGSFTLNQKYGVHRQLLHASTLSFIHPRSGERFTLEAPIPPDMQKFIAEIEKGH